MEFEIRKFLTGDALITKCPPITIEVIGLFSRHAFAHKTLNQFQYYT